jgi:autotransporter translocation and assembly factor TamB
LRRALRLLLRSAAGLLALALAGYLIACQTGWGRERVRLLALAQLGPLFAGRINVGEISRLALSGIRLRDLTVFDPSGNQVLALAELELDWSPLGLLSGELVLGRLALRSGRIDLADLSAQHGLLAALPAVAAAPEPPVRKPPLRLRLAELSLAGLELSAEVPGAGVLAARNLAVQASYRQGGAIELELASLSAELRRDGHDLGRIDSAAGRYVSAGAPSMLRLAGQLAGARLRLEATSRVPGDPGFEDAPLQLSAQLERLDAATLTALGQAEWAAALRQVLDVQVEVTGSARAPQGTFTIRSAAGVVRGQALLTAERVARLRVSAEELALAEWVAGLPAGRLQGTLTGEAALSESGRVPVQLRFSEGHYDELTLPELSARARVSGRQLRELAIELHGYEGSLTVAGEASLDGDVRADIALSLPRLDQLPRWPGLPVPAGGALTLRSGVELQQGQLHARGTLALGALQLPALSLAALHSDFELEGDLLAPSLHTTLRASALRAGAVRAEIARLRLDVRRTPAAFVLGMAARGQLQGEPFELSVQRASIGPGTALDVRGVQARALGQRVLLSGRFGPSGGEGLLQAHGIDLARLSAAFALQPALAGTAELRATARGPLQAPIVTLSLRGSELRIADAPTLTLAVQAELDAGRGQARLETRAADDAGREIAVRARATFNARPGSSWAQRLDSVRLDADAALERIDNQALEAWLAQPLPLQGTASLHVWVNGSLREPALQSELRAQLRQLAPGRDAEVLVQANYARGEAHGALIVTDPDGPWLDAQLHLAHPAGQTRAVLGDAARLLDRAAWDTRIELYPRRLTALPIALRLPEDPASLELAAQLSASHAPGQAPQAELQLNLRQRERASTSAACAGLASDLDLRAHLEAGQLDARAAVLRGAHPVAELSARSELDLEPLLVSEGPLRLRGLELDAALDEVDLATLPLICNRVRGRISGSAQVRALLEASPQLSLALRAQRLSLDGRNFSDATLEASVHSALAQLALVVQHGETRSTLTARLPLELQGGALVIPSGVPLAAQARFDHLPLGALVPPGAAISRATGTLSGSIDLAGTRAAPELQGELVPEGVGFTATALAQPLTDIGGRILIRKDRIDIERLGARDGDGTLSVSGTLALRPAASGADAALSLLAKELPLRQQGRVAGTLDAKLRVVAGLDAQAARVAVQLDEASLWLRGGELRQGIELGPHPDIIDPRAAPRSSRVDAEPAPASELPLELSLEARDSFWVRREDFAVKLSAQLTASRKQGELRIRGPVALRRGYLQLLGKVFELGESSRIEFVGSSPPDPVLDIQAQARNRGQSETVTVKISGRARAPVLEFMVDDRTVSAGEAAEKLFAPRATGGTAMSQVQSFVGGLSSGLLALSARSELGEMMPILLVEPGSETSASRVRAGFELDSLVPRALAGIIRGVYVEGIIASGNGQQQQDTGGGVLLELYLPHDLVTSGQYGPGETWSIDLGWQP